MHMMNNCFPSRYKRAHNQTSEAATTQKHIPHLHKPGKRKSAPGGSALICTTIRAKSTVEFSKIRCRGKLRARFLQESQDRLQWTNFQYRKRPNIRSVPAKDPNDRKPATDR